MNHHRKLWGTLEVGVGLVRVTGTEGKGGFHGEATLGKGVNPEDPGTVGPKLSCPIPIGPEDHGEEDYMMVSFQTQLRTHGLTERRPCNQIVKSSSVKTETGDQTPASRLQELCPWTTCGTSVSYGPES